MPKYRTIVTQPAPPPGAQPSARDYRVDLGQDRNGYFADIYDKNGRRIKSSMHYPNASEVETWVRGYIDNQVYRRRNLSSSEGHRNMACKTVNFKAKGKTVSFKACGKSKGSRSVHPSKLRAPRDAAGAYGFEQGRQQGFAEWGSGPFPPEMETATDPYARGYRHGRWQASNNMTRNAGGSRATKTEWDKAMSTAVNRANRWAREYNKLQASLINTFGNHGAWISGGTKAHWPQHKRDELRVLLQNRYQPAQDHVKAVWKQKHPRKSFLTSEWYGKLISAGSYGLGKNLQGRINKKPAGSRATGRRGSYPTDVAAFRRAATAAYRKTLAIVQPNDPVDLSGWDWVDTSDFVFGGNEYHVDAYGVVTDDASGGAVYFSGEKGPTRRIGAPVKRSAGRRAAPRKACSGTSGRRVESVLSPGQGTSDPEVARFLSAIEAVYRKHFPLGYFYARASRKFGGNAIYIATATLPKGQQTNGIIENDPSYNTFWMHNSYYEHGLAPRIKVEMSQGNSYRGRGGWTKVGWRNGSAAPASIVKKFDKYFAKLALLANS